MNLTMHYNCICKSHINCHVMKDKTACPGIPRRSKRPKRDLRVVLILVHHSILLGRGPDTSEVSPPLSESSCTPPNWELRLGNVMHFFRNSKFRSVNVSVDQGNAILYQISQLTVETWETGWNAPAHSRNIVHLQTLINLYEGF